MFGAWGEEWVTQWAWSSFFGWWKCSKINCGDSCTTLWITLKTIEVHTLNCMIYRFYLNKAITKKQACLRVEDRYKRESAGSHSSASTVNYPRCNHMASHSEHLEFGITKEASGILGEGNKHILRCQYSIYLGHSHNNVFPTDFICASSKANQANRCRRAGSISRNDLPFSAASHLPTCR